MYSLTPNFVSDIKRVNHSWSLVLLDFCANSEIFISGFLGFLHHHLKLSLLDLFTRFQKMVEGRFVTIDFFTFASEDTYWRDIGNTTCKGACLI